MSSNIIMTIAIGEDYRKIASVTLQSIADYAEKLNVPMIVLDKPKISSSSPHWEKFQIYDALTVCDRVLYLDSDLIIHPDCPDLFRLTAPTHIGAFNEGKYADRPEHLIRYMADFYGYPMPVWDGKYYNTGVMVVSKCHQHLFKKPSVEQRDSYFHEQSYINMMIALHKVPVYDLGYDFNRMGCVDGSGKPVGDRMNSYILHYAGWHWRKPGTTTLPTVNDLICRINEDLKTWIEYEKTQPVNDRDHR